VDVEQLASGVAHGSATQGKPDAAVRQGAAHAPASSAVLAVQLVESLITNHLYRWIA
jgi:hypothetical protein